jgi:hypothetical protein
MDRTTLTRMTVAQLRDLANVHQVPGTAKLKKAELIEAITARLNAAPPSGAVEIPSGRAPTPGGSPAGSSATTAPPPPPPQRGPDPGLPIPAAYGQDRLVLMVQDPWHLFAYWEVTAASIARATATAGDGWAAVRLIDTPNGRESREIDLKGGNYYLAVSPDSPYTALLALRDPSGNLHVLASSNQVRTPAATVSDRQDEAWMSVDETFHELLELAGLPGDSGSSATRLSSAAAARRMVAWNLTHVDSQALFSGILQGGPSSSSLSSTTLSSREPQRR